MRHLLVLLVLSLAACALLGGPPADPAEYPCGYNGKSCGSHMCCGENDDCGSEANAPYGCGPGLCCFHGDPRVGMAARKPPTKQFPEKKK